MLIEGTLDADKVIYQVADLTEDLFLGKRNWNARIGDGLRIPMRNRSCGIRSSLMIILLTLSDIRRVLDGTTGLAGVDLAHFT